MPPGPASALVATSILSVEAEGGGRVGTPRWSAASSSVPVGFVRSVPRLSLEGEGGFDAEQEPPPPPPSELEVGEWRRRRGCGHIGGRAPHCWKEARGGEIRKPGRARAAGEHPGPGPGSRTVSRSEARPRRKTRTFWARAVDDSRAVKTSLQGPYPSEKEEACLFGKPTSWDSK